MIARCTCCGLQLEDPSPQDFIYTEGCPKGTNSGWEHGTHQRIEEKKHNFVWTKTIQDKEPNPCLNF